MAPITPASLKFLRALPKCEHHMHLEGSLSPSLLFALAAKNNITLPASTDPAYASIEALHARYDRFTGLDDFLGYYYIGMSVLINIADFEDLAYAYFQKAHEDGVRHAEVFFDPQAHTARGVELDTVVKGFAAGCARAEAEFGISSKLIMCFLRHLPAAEATAVFTEAHSAGHFDGTVHGIGLDSSEVGFRPELFREVFALAGEKGLRMTAHAGEEGDHTNVSAALDELRVSRIDHGIRARDEPAVVERLAREGVLLTVCPLSNVKLRAVKSVSELPIREFLARGVSFSINSDDPAYFGGYCLDNYVAVHEAFGLSVAEWRGIVAAGIKGSWCDDKRKEVLMDILDKAVEEHGELLD
jgi:adenosine deaminase